MTQEQWKQHIEQVNLSKKQFKISNISLQGVTVNDKQIEEILEDQEETISDYEEPILDY